jgi:hypothetical protein
MEPARKPHGRQVAAVPRGFHRGAGIRTRDLLLPKQARYRTAPHPVITRQQLRRVRLRSEAECASSCASTPLSTTVSIARSSACR